mgnify:CR=1
LIFGLGGKSAYKGANAACLYTNSGAPLAATVLKNYVPAEKVGRDSAALTVEPGRLKDNVFLQRRRHRRQERLQRLQHPQLHQLRPLRRGIWDVGRGIRVFLSGPETRGRFSCLI